MLGTNDAKWCNWYGAPNGLPSGNGTQFGNDYVKMITLFKALPSRPKVLLCCRAAFVALAAAASWREYERAG